MISLNPKLISQRLEIPCLVNDQLYPYLLRVCGLDSHEASETEVSKNQSWGRFRIDSNLKLVTTICAA